MAEPAGHLLIESQPTPHPYIAVSYLGRLVWDPGSYVITRNWSAEVVTLVMFWIR